MSLRAKMEILLVLILGLVVGIGYLAQQHIVLPSFASKDADAARDDVRRAAAEIRTMVARLDSYCNEWAKNEETLRFIRGDAPLAEGNLTRLPAPGENDVGIVFALDRDGRVVKGEAIDYTTREPITLDTFAGDAWPRTHPLRQIESINDSLRGVVVTNAGPALIAVRPIVSWDADDGIGGTLVLGRLWDDSLFIDVAKVTSGAVRFFDPHDNTVGPEDRAIYDSLLDGATSRVVALGRDHVRVYGVFPALDAGPAFFIRDDVQRAFTPAIRDAIGRGLIVQLLTVLVGFGAAYIGLRTLVINPLTRLINHAEQITKTEDLSNRIELNRRDEFGTLGREFNRMVERLDGDISARKHAERQLRESEERYALAVRGANEGLWDWNLKTNKMYYSPRWKSLLGYAEEEVAASPEAWFNLIHPEDLSKVKAGLDAHLAGQTAHFESEHRMLHRDQSYVWMLARGLAVENVSGERARMAGSLADVNARKRAEEQLTHKALHDTLTDLPNRALLVERLRQAIRMRERYSDYLFAVIFLDLDRFKVINDSLGHVIGDQLLMAFAKKVNRCVRTTDLVSRFSGTVARFGGDEFVVLLEGLADLQDATIVAERIQTMLQTPFAIDEHEVYTTASIGIAPCVEAVVEPDEFLRNADTAMYYAKNQGRACHVVFDETMHERALGRMRLETDLRHCLERNELAVHYQPIVSLETGKISAFEALVRWHHPTRGTIPPVEFVPVAEEMGLIVEIGQWVLREACTQAVTWQRKYVHAADLSISVNVSVRQFSDPEFVASVREVIEQTGIHPARLKLEITESVIMENVELVRDTLQELRDLRLKLSLDDFGTGYSSLSYLHRFPMNVLKIDQSFIRNLNHGRENYQLVRTILMMAHNFDMSAIAEGVEELEQISHLRELACEDGQGYYFSRPLTPDDADALLAGNPEWAAATASRAG